MEQRNKNLFIGGLLAIVLIMAVGYAAFATQLTINGTAEITSNWDVHISDIQVAAVSGEVGTGTSTGKSVTEGNLTATFESELVAPGDSVTYDVTVVNEGSLPAKLNGITFTQTNNGTGTAEEGDAVENQGTNYEGDNAIVYSYSNLAKDSVLEAEEGTITFQVKVEYNPKVSKQPDAKQLKSKLKMVLSYVQSTD